MAPTIEAYEALVTLSAEYMQALSFAAVHVRPKPMDEYHAGQAFRLADMAAVSDISAIRPIKAVGRGQGGICVCHYDRSSKGFSGVIPAETAAASLRPS